MTSHRSMGAQRAAGRRLRSGILLSLILVAQATIGLWHRPHGDVLATPLAFAGGEGQAELGAAPAADCAGCPHHSAGRPAADCDLCLMRQQPQEMVPAAPRLAESGTAPENLGSWTPPAIDRSLNLCAWGPRGPPA